MLAEEPAPAKLNLALHVRRRRLDGYHDLETLFAFTAFGDRLAAHPADAWALELEGPFADAAGPLADNLVLKAARAFADASGSRARYAFRLLKRIPVAAGLGGGSADAAATLRLLNRLAGAPLDSAALAQLAAGLGADVPACLHARTAFATGLGERLSPGPDLAGTPILLVNPGVAVPTGPVFAVWDGVDRGSLGADWRAGRNDLEPPAIRLQPVIAEVLGWLAGLPGVRLARMSGSGATCFALGEGLDRAADHARARGWWAEPTSLL